MRSDILQGFCGADTVVQRRCRQAAVAAAPVPLLIEDAGTA